MNMNKKLMSILITAAAALCFNIQVADAQDDPLSGDDERVGLTIGIGAGLGHMECSSDYCDGVTEAGGLNAHLGIMFARQLAIVGDVWAMAHSDDRLTVSQSMATVGPQVWLLPRLWVRAGLGVTRASYNYDASVVELMDSTDWHPAGMAAVGVEVLQRDTLAMDIQLRAGTGLFNDAETQVHNVSLGLGVSWF